MLFFFVRVHDWIYCFSHCYQCYQCMRLGIHCSLDNMVIFSSRPHCGYLSIMVGWNPFAIFNLHVRTLAKKKHQNIRELFQIMVVSVSNISTHCKKKFVWVSICVWVWLSVYMCLRIFLYERCVETILKTDSGCITIIRPYALYYKVLCLAITLISGLLISNSPNE